ncbi:dipeptidase [Pseudocolwellia agarivorans]|uniref:dipeptidase n=1 Tax=Pseudocolwellia agarivorans TaxID=1911682 RepID=UPI001FE64A69|nr:dipeptidase [Pseudocolwellia agarivorans]
MLKKLSLLTLLTPLMFTTSTHANEVSTLADKTANYAVNTYKTDMVNSLAQLVKHNTVVVDGVPSPENPVHIAFKQELKKQATELGLDFKDDGFVVIIGLGNAKERLGIITHGDVQPANPSKWKQSPYTIDLTSKPGLIIGRGTEDDKGPISTALYAMKAIKDKKIQLNKRLELYIYMAEESDWAPLEEYIKTHDLPETNITIDAEYPAVIAEKGYGTISLTFPNKSINTQQAYLKSFTGGFFGSQIPEDAVVIIENADVKLLQKLMNKAKAYNNIGFSFDLTDQKLTISALGKSAHSSKPEDGVNAITYLADLISFKRWPTNTSGALVNFINDNIGTGLYGKKFGDIAFSDEFMGPLTVSPTVLKQLDNGMQLNINIRRPRGKDTTVLKEQITQAITQWSNSNEYVLTDVSTTVKEPWVQQDAPQLETLLTIFSHYTGIKSAKPISIGGGTNSRMFPRAISFGPSMPNTEYSGHTESEFITMDQFMLNLKMYTAAFIELAK